MESQPQNPEFRNNPENFHTCSIISLNFLPEEMLDPWLHIEHNVHISKTLIRLHGYAR